MAALGKKELDADVRAARVEQQQETRLAFAPVAMKTGLAARYLGLSRRHLTTLAARGVLSYVRVGPRCHLYRRSELDAFLAARTVNARGGIA